ncbi:MAG TPA: hypothetical protein VGF62_03210 [Rhizomicrobium sp.]
MKVVVAIASLFALVSASAATAADISYTGNWPVKLSHDVFLTTNGYTGHGPNSTHCLALTDDGSVGCPHSGFAVLDNNINSSGQFAVIGHTILIYIYTLGSGQEPASLVFSTDARNGIIGKRAAFDNVQGGTSFDAADATFGQKNGC